MTLKVSIDMAKDVTVGDLYGFVDAARASAVPPATLVTKVEVPGLDQVIDRLDLEVSQVAGPPGVFLSIEEAGELVSVLGAIIGGDGDARAHLDDLRRLQESLFMAGLGFARPRA